jgi:hypothetical protein
MAMAAAGKIDWRYTETRRRVFLRVLAETYDVEAALEAGRLTWPQVCELRARYSAFALRFEEVIAAGYDRLEAMLLREAGIGAGAKADAALAQALLKQRRAARAEAARPSRAAARHAARNKHLGAIMGEFETLRAGQKQGSGAIGEGSGVGAARKAARPALR